MNNTNEIEQIDIKRLFEVALDRIVSIVVITLAFGLIFFAVSEYFIQEKYQSSITMYVNNRRSTVNDELENKTLSSDITASQQLVPTYIEMLKSDNVLEEVADKVYEESGEEISAYQIRQMLSAEALSETEIIEINVKAENPAKAMLIANSIADVAPAKIQEFIERSDVHIIDRAKRSTNPVSPNVRNNIILGALLGFVLSISFILLREIFDVRVKSVDDLVQRFQYPVLGTVPEIYISYDDSSLDEESDQ